MTTQTVDEEQLLVHTWRVARLPELGISRAVARSNAHLDWHQVARLVQHGCPPGSPCVSPLTSGPVKLPVRDERPWLPGTDSLVSPIAGEDGRPQFTRPPASAVCDAPHLRRGARRRRLAEQPHGPGAGRRPVRRRTPEAVVMEVIREVASIMSAGGESSHTRREPRRAEGARAKAERAQGEAAQAPAATPPRRGRRVEAGESRREIEVREQRQGWQAPGAAPSVCPLDNGSPYGYPMSGLDIAVV